LARTNLTKSDIVICGVVQCHPPKRKLNIFYRKTGILLIKSLKLVSERAFRNSYVRPGLADAL
jgi:hypothetical protein